MTCCCCNLCIQFAVLGRREPERRAQVGARVAGAAGRPVRTGSHAPAGQLDAQRARPQTGARNDRRSAQLPQPLFRSRRLSPLRLRLPARILRVRLQSHGR